jgi:hypothetical protein
MPSNRAIQQLNDAETMPDLQNLSQNNASPRLPEFISGIFCCPAGKVVKNIDDH